MSYPCQRWFLTIGLACLLLSGCATYSPYGQTYRDDPYDHYRPYNAPYPRHESAYEQGYRDGERDRARASQYYNRSHNDEKDYERGYEKGKKEAKREAKERSRQQTEYRPAPEYRPPIDHPAPSLPTPTRGTLGVNDG